MEIIIFVNCPVDIDHSPLACFKRLVFVCLWQCLWKVHGCSLQFVKEKCHLHLYLEHCCAMQRYLWRIHISVTVIIFLQKRGYETKNCYLVKNVLYIVSAQLVLTFMRRECLPEYGVICLFLLRNDSPTLPAILNIFLWCSFFFFLARRKTIPTKPEKYVVWYFYHTFESIFSIVIPAIWNRSL